MFETTLLIHLIPSMVYVCISMEYHMHPMKVVLQEKAQYTRLSHAG